MIMSFRVLLHNLSDHCLTAVPPRLPMRAHKSVEWSISISKEKMPSGGRLERAKTVGVDLEPA